MAIYHLHASTGSRKGGQSASAKSDYIQREGRYARDKDEVEHTQSGNMPDWVEHPRDYWDAADTHERANGVLFREVEFSLPRELTPDQRKALAEDFAQHLTHDEKLPYTLAIHSGKGENPHCHLMISERLNDGIERDAQQWFKRYNAKAPERGGSQKADISSRRKAWLEQTRQDWADMANHALERAGHAARIDHRTLDAQGIERVPGIHLGPNVVEMEARGITTERADRALGIEAANDQISELQQHREAIEYERHRESQAVAEHGRASREHRAVGPEHGNTGRRSAGADRRPDRSQQAEHAPLERAADPHRADVEGRRRRDAESGQRPPDAGTRRPPSREGLDVAAMGGRPDRLDDAYSGAADRIMALAGSPTGDHRGRGAMAAPAQPVKGDRTTQAMQRQLKAMGCDRYEIGIRHADSGKMMNRSWSSDEVLKNAAWLKRLNAQGNDIYVRPAQEERHGLVLVDDLSRDDLDAMKTEGREPALTVETSPENYQAWVKTTPRAATEATRGEIAKQLAREYQADPASAESRHYGRLAGFTNRKDKHTTKTGQQPWVLCRESSGEVASAGPELIRQGKERRDAAERQREQASRLAEIEAPDSMRRYRRSAVDDYRSEMRGLVKRYGDDLSKCDFIASMKLAAKGRSADEISTALQEASPSLADRKTGHQEDYARRTVAKAMEVPEVQEARQKLAEQQHQRKGPELGM